MPASELFGNIPGDPLGFGLDNHFQPERVRDFLRMDKKDVSRVTGLSLKSIRYDDNAPRAMIERIEEIALTCNMVAEAFDNDPARTALWFRTKNPMLGDIAPREMIRLGRFDRLRRFIISAITERAKPKGKNAGD